MSGPMQRNDPECQKAEFEGDPIPLEDFYDKDDNIVIVDNGVAVAILDFEDAIIMLQYKNDMSTFMMNLLYARSHMPNLYHLWFKEKSNKDKQRYYGSESNPITR